MRKHYTLKGFMVLFSLLIFKAGAQLSGVVTINSALATGSGNYQTFNALAAVLNTAGISAPLTVNVVTGSGPYNEQVTFLQTPGISSTNTITINGNGCTISFNSTVAATPWTILLSGADYMTINNLNVTGSGPTYALACHLWNGANNNQFVGCHFSTPTNVTGATQSPFSITGTSVSPTATGNSGNNNTVNTCTMTGGYYNTTLVGASGAPFNTGNQVINSLMREFYYYGLYHYYCQSSVIRGNVVERPTRTSIQTGYGIYLTTGSINTLVERNHIRKMAGGAPGGATAIYAFYIAADATLNNENRIINNLVSDINANSTQAGMYITGGSYNKVYHNTFVLDDVASTTGATYGMYCTGPNNSLRNNIVSITRGGSGAKACVYLTTAATQLVCDNNVLYMNSPAGVNGVGFLTSNYPTLANWQATNFDLMSSDADPIFTNPATMNYLPTNVAVNNLCPPLGITNDFNLAARSLLFPDPGAFEMFNLPCSATPGTNAFVTPTVALCPGSTVNLNLQNSNTYTNTGYMIQWQMATANILGPYTAVPGATLNSYTTPPINANTFYNAVIWCVNGGSTLTVPAQMITVAPTTTNNVPYYEGFESLSLNELPNCSWNSTSPNGSTLTYTSVNTSLRVPHNGTNYAAFGAGTNYFYSNGVYLQPGITYSAALFFIHETAGFNNWADLSILIGPSQSPAGAITVATTNGTLTPQLYTLLSNTFTVQSPGLYYAGIRASSGAGAAAYLSWDDLSITIPCNFNTPFVQLIPNVTTVCSGQPVNLSAIGANSYSWSTGQTGPFVTLVPSASGNYVLTATSPLSGCSTTVSQYITVNPSPQVIAYASDPEICAGTSVTLGVQGASTYFWDNGVNAASNVVTPMGSTTYSVIGTNAFNCSSMAIVQVTVHALPGVSAAISSSIFCEGQGGTLIGTGAQSYQWLTSSNSLLLGSPVTFIAGASSSFTMIGTDVNGCESTATVEFRVDQCTGIHEPFGEMGKVVVYPNPSAGVFYIESGGGSNLNITVMDITGRTLRSDVAVKGAFRLDIGGFANGIYYLNVSSQNSSEIIKLVKH